MEEQPGLSDQYRRSSPWPMFIALGFVLSELGILFGGALVPIAVGGVVLLEASVIGILRESDYASTLWAPALGIGALFALAGGALFYWGLRIRAVTVVSAGVIAFLAGIGFWLDETGRL
ncbi:DUF7541 family protein [Salarchaeum japonicum]|uniref:DUF7541 family protein n=1 Tax=Salarchaeum japonicum TaxID=555573 RepID=UPI003C735FA5